MKTKIKKRLTKEEMRVLIAKDVIKQLNTGELRPNGGTYYRFNVGRDREVVPATLVDRYGIADLKAVIDYHSQEKPLTCVVCAKGALFVAAVKRFNQYWVSSPYELWAYSSGFKRYLRRYFPQLQLDLMEVAFETGHGNYWDVCNKYPTKASAAYREFRQYRSLKKRMIAIMRNIIRNKGNFVVKLK